VTPKLTRIADLDAHRADWDALAERSGNVFATWEWNATWWRHFGAGRELWTFACHDDPGRLAAILPLYLSSRRPLRVLRYLGHGPGDELRPVCAPEDRGLAADGLREGLPRSGWDVLLAERMPAAEGWAGRTGGHVLRRESSPVLSIAGRSWDEYLAGRSRNFREQARRRERKLAREHELRYRMADDPARLEHDMTTLFRLHEARWGKHGSGALSGQREGFHRDFAAQALERGWLRLAFLEVDDDPVAAWYGMRYADADWFYQAGRDPAWDGYSAGFVLMVHTIRTAFEDGMREYRLLRGDEEYKGRFAGDDPGLDTVAIPRGLAGRAAIGIGRAGLRAPGPLRRAFARLAGGR
jgi:CelD/BcsL family acetyltransferase involved in cellulose biosynthesis